MKYFKYLKYVIRHKWYVFLEACKLGIPIRGLLHDMSKFDPKEFFPYVEYFYGEQNTRTKNKFNEAWLYHQKRNKHHWQFWVLQNDSGSEVTIPIPEKYLKELIADWRGMSRVFGKPTSEALDFYHKNSNNIKMCCISRAYLENHLGD